GGSSRRCPGGLGAGGGPRSLRGAGLLLGLALLNGLAGTLLETARVLAPKVSGAARLGTRCLWPSATLAVLAAGHIAFRGARQREEALAAGASSVALLVLLAGALAAALLRRLATPSAAATDAADFER